MKSTFLSIASSVVLLAVVACSSKDATSSSGAGVSTIDVSPSTCALKKGGSQQFAAQATYADGSKQVVTKSAEWTSSDTTVATVDANGNMVAVSDGTITITAGIGGKTASAGCVIAF